MSEKKVTVSQIAEATGVSPATVSRVLNHPELVKKDTLDLIQSAMLNLGCKPDKLDRLPSPKQKVIVLNLPDTQNVFYDEVLRGATVSAQAHDCYLLIHESPIDHGTIRSFCNLLHRINAAGVILLNQVSSDLLDQIHAVVPLVQCCEYNKETNYPYVSIDDSAAAENATNHLLACGRNKIAFVNGPLSFKYAAERQYGFTEAMKHADIFVPQNWIIQLPKVNYDMAYAAICRILNAETIPNAFFMSSDIFAMALIRAAKRYQLSVPRDIMVVGFDNIAFSMMMSPSITTVNQPTFQMGYSACEMLIEIILTPDFTPKSILLDTELVIRESTSIGYANP